MLRRLLLPRSPAPPNDLAHRHACRRGGSTAECTRKMSFKACIGLSTSRSSSAPPTCFCSERRPVHGQLSQLLLCESLASLYSLCTLLNNAAPHSSLLITALHSHNGDPPDVAPAPSSGSLSLPPGQQRESRESIFWTLTIQFGCTAASNESRAK